MKKVFLFLFSFTLLVSSCDNTADSIAPEDNNAVDLENLGAFDMNEFSLVPYGLNLTVLLPEVESSTGASIEPEVIHEDGDYLWSLNIGKNFNLIIEDFGKEKNKVSEEKEYLNGQTNIFQFEYVVDEPNIIMYKRELHEDQGGKKSYHCYGEMEVEGYTIVLRTNESGSFKPVVADMVSTIKSAKAIAKS
jgi:hypothetical protein